MKFGKTIKIFLIDGDSNGRMSCELSKHKQEMHDFQPPLDIVDGAARVCDPFIDGINTGKHWSGQFLKDYFPISW